MMPFLIILVTWIIIAAVIAAVSSARRGTLRVPPQSSDGHFVPRQQDLTCETQYGHQHGNEPNKRYIVHEDPPEGYVILNGVKRKISDCKYL